MHAHLYSLYPSTRRLILLAGFTCCAAAQAQVVINEENFPDENFRAYVTELETSYGDGDGTFSKNELNDITSIGVDGRNIESLQGIENFKNITYLSCTNNEDLKVLDLSQNTKLESVYANYSGNYSSLSSINVSGLTRLAELYLEQTEVQTLDLSGCSRLSQLRLQHNEQLTTLTLTGCSALDMLDCSYCERLQELELKALSKLTHLNATDNSWKRLDISGLTKLQDVYVGGEYANQLEEINASGCSELYSLGMNTESMRLLNLSNCNALSAYSLYDAPQLTSFDISNCRNLSDLRVGSMNSLTDFNISGLAKLEYFQLTHSPAITAVDLSGLTKLASASLNANESLTELNVEGCSNLTNLECSDNQLKALDIQTLKNLETLNCGSNQIEQLSLNCPKLQSLSCNNNQIAALDLSQSAGLNNLDCSDNLLKTLDLAKNINLESLYAQNNNLTSIDLSKNTKLQWYNLAQRAEVVGVLLAKDQVGYRVDDLFQADRVASLSVDWNERTPSFAIVDGIRYFVVFDDASASAELIDKPITYTYTTGHEDWTMDVEVSITSLIKAPSFIQVSEDVVKGVYGGTATAPAVSRSQDYDGALSYASSNEKVVTVAEDGKLTIIGAGTATITVKGAEAEYRQAPEDVTYQVEIAKAEPVFAFENETMEADKADGIEANALSIGLYDGAVVYATSDEAVATVAADGTVTLVGEGTVTITATGAETDNCMGSSASYTIVVTDRLAAVGGIQADSRSNLPRYNLEGMRVRQTQKGRIYIVDGKKQITR